MKKILHVVSKKQNKSDIQLLYLAVFFAKPKMKSLKKLFVRMLSAEKKENTQRSEQILLRMLEEIYNNAEKVAMKKAIKLLFRSLTCL